MPRATHAPTRYRRLPLGNHLRSREIAAPQKLIRDA
jgi:hypothetical protein